MSPNNPPPLDAIYLRSRERLTGLVSSLPDAKAVPVPGCPGWSAHDVISHLVAVAEDAVAGRLTRPPTDAETAAQVSRRADRPTNEVLTDWDEHGPRLEAMLASVTVWPAVMDVITHEQDLHAGPRTVPGFRDDPDLVGLSRLQLSVLDLPLTVRCGGEVFNPGAELTLETDWFEFFRVRFGRRSRRQLAALRWSGDPSPVLGRLTMFGPSLEDIIE